MDYVIQLGQNKIVLPNQSIGIFDCLSQERIKEYILSPYDKLSVVSIKFEGFDT